MAEKQAGDSGSNSAPTQGRGKSAGQAVLAALASTSLTLWLLGLLGVAMALGTLIPQGAPEAAYQRAFGEATGRFIARGTLAHLYGSWWFVGLFVVLWVNLAACVVQRTSLLLSGKPLRGAAASWGVVVVHCGMLVVLVGAAYGRWPSRVYRDVVALRPGHEHRVPAFAGGFTVRLLSAGERRDASGRPTAFWARAQLTEDGRTLRTVTIRPNQPLRYRAVSVVLQSLPSPEMAVEARHAGVVSRVPIALNEHGEVAIMGSLAILREPKWLAFVHRLREEGGHVSAMVIVDESGKVSHNWERVGWVDEQGLNFKGVSFRLVEEGQGAQLSFDRDVGVPIVWVGFVLLTVGSLLACLGTPKGSEAEGSR